ncbi:MAG TPA: hypothetical protein VFD62_11380 [Pyrinomonadaceae bacterium]|nr:hypothetical protein [Pyrinomonadaceae bacterium]
MEIGHQPILSRVAQFDTWASRKRKDPSRASSAAKGLGRGADLFALPDAPGAYVGAVLTAAPDHKGR